MCVLLALLAHADRVIYEWEQSLEEVNVFITPPRGVTAQDILCEITASHVTLGLRGVADKFLNVTLRAPSFSVDDVFVTCRRLTRIAWD